MRGSTSGLAPLSRLKFQCITYRDFIPIFLGPNALTAYTGYKSTVNPRVSLAFLSPASVSDTRFCRRSLSAEQKNLSQGDVLLNDALYQPQLIVNFGIEPCLSGPSKQIPQEVGTFVIGGVRNFVALAGGGFDLATLNMQRGRDHGLPSYNQLRIDYGLASKATFAEVTSKG
jgi:peroxidase